MAKNEDKDGVRSPVTNLNNLDMALITCPECGNAVSTEARMCPSCGYPVAERRSAEKMAAAAGVPLTTDPNTPLLQVRPSWWNYGWHLLFFFLLIPPLIAIYRRYSFSLVIYPDRITIIEGFWSKEYSDFFIRDIRSVDVRQGIWARMVRIGDILISTAATVEASETAPGVPDPDRIKELLISLRQQTAGEYDVSSTR